MGRKVSGKERHRLKRKKKRQTLRKLNAGSPYRRIGSAGQLESCLINEDWRQRGQAVVWVLRGVPRGGWAMASFMIDLWCAGLKDAWGRINITASEFHEGVDRMSYGTGLRFVETDLATAQAVVAGAVRFAVRNGFRLPHRHERWTSMLGGIGDWRSADLSDFGRDGKLCWVGPIEDLRDRLIGCRVEEFLDREDVEYVLGSEGVYEADEGTRAVDEVADRTRQRALDDARRWCFANGEPPHPRLAEAVEITLESILQLQDTDEEEPVEDAAEGIDNINRFLSLQQLQDRAELLAAMDQLGRFIRTFRDPEQFMEALGFGKPA